MPVSARPPKAGERFENRGLARALRDIASHGSKAFYEGWIADDLVRTLRGGGGLHSEAALSKLKPEHREAIMKLCRESEEKFWAISQEEDVAKLAILKGKGMEILDPSPELSAELVKRAIPLWDNMLKSMGPGAQQAVAEFRKRTGK